VSASVSVSVSASVFVSVSVSVFVSVSTSVVCVCVCVWKIILKEGREAVEILIQARSLTDPCLCPVYDLYYV